MNILEIKPGKLLIPVFLVISVLSSGCGSYIQETIVVFDNKVQEQNENVIYMPSDPTDQTFIGLSRKQSVIRFYQQRNFRAAWIKDKHLSSIGDSLISLIENIRYYGLSPLDYHLNEIIVENQRSEPDFLRLDALCTDAFFKVSKDFKYGRLSNHKKASDDTHSISMLHQIVINGTNLKSTLEFQEPGFIAYHSLKESLRLTLDDLKIEDRSMIMRGGFSKERRLNKKLQSMEINLERWRWENYAFGARYIFINVPSYSLQVFSQGSVILESQVLVGTPQTPTPTISRTIDCFVLFPYWQLPKKFIVDKYLPLIQRDTSFISRNNFDVFDRTGNLLDPKKIEWKKYNKKNFPFFIRKREDPESSLGVLDLYYIEFPLYIFHHDAIDRTLFGNDNKTVTDGSIKFEKAVELARFLYNDYEGQKMPLEKYLKLKKRKVLDISNPIPVHVRYFTCEYKGNKFYQYEDIYGKDRKLIEKFYNMRGEKPNDLSRLIH